MKFSVQTSGVERTKHISIIVVSQILTGIIFTTFLYIIREHIAYWVLGVNRPDWMIYIVIILFLDSIWNLPLLILRSEEKATLFIGFSLLNVIATMLLNILFVVYWGYGIEGVFLANIISSGIILVFSSPIIINRIKVKLFDKIVFKKVFQFAIPFLPAGVFTMVMELSDRYLLEWFLGIADVGLYSAGKKMGMLGLTIVMGFNMGWTPYFLKRGQEKGAKIEFAKIATLFSGIMGYISMLVSIWVGEIMQLSIFGQTLIGSEFWNCEPVVSVILTGYFFFGTYVIQLPGVYMKEITNWVPIFRITGALTLILSCIWLIPILGFMGAAYSVVFAFLAMNLSIYFKTYRIYRVPYNWRAILFPIIFLVGAQLNIGDLLPKLWLTIIYPLLWYFFALTNDEKQDLIRLVR